MSVARLIVTRHGESEANRKRVFAGQSDSPLTPAGRAQAEALAEALAAEPIARVIASDLSRARDTAAAVARRRGLAVETASALREWDVGELVGLDREMTQQRYGDVRRFFEPGSRVPGGESFEEVVARVTAFVDGLVPDSLGRTVCLVAHGMTNRIVAAHFMGSLPHVGGHNSANTNITIVETDGRTHRIVKLFDDAHVPIAHDAPGAKDAPEG